MPSLSHEALRLLFRNRPGLAPDLLQRPYSGPARQTTVQVGCSDGPGGSKDVTPRRPSIVGNGQKVGPEETFLSESAGSHPVGAGMPRLLHGHPAAIHPFRQSSYEEPRSSSVTPNWNPHAGQIS